MSDAQFAGQIPDPAVVVLIGASGSGKSTWAARWYRSVEVVSSDGLRGVVGSGPHDLDASTDAFAVLDAVVRARVGRRLTTVIDTLGLDPVRRLGYRELAAAAGMPAVAVLVDTDPEECRRRNGQRDIPVPATALAAQLKRMRDLPAQIAGEGWDLVISVGQSAARPAPVPASVAPAGPTVAGDGDGLEFVLQISRFPWGEDPTGWLAGVVRAADQVGFAGIALMDHLIQIPQVGRAWDPMPEPWVTLGLIAGLTAGLGSRLKLGTLVSPVTYREPGILAKTVATLDALSGGRAFCGLGAGWWDREHAGHGLDFPSPGRRLDRLEQTIETLRALWSSGTKAYDGKRISLPETTSYPRPVGPVPIIVGGSGARTLRIAAAAADAINVRTPELDRAVAVLAGSERTVALTVLDVPILGRNRDDTAALVERLRGRVAAATFAARHYAGEADHQIARYRGLAAAGVSTVFVSLPDLAGPDELTKCAPVITAFD